MRPSIAVLVLAGMALGAMAPAGAQTISGGRGKQTRPATQPAAGQTGSRTGQQVKDPGEYYLNAYNLCQEAAELARKKNYTQAIKKGMRAEKVLAAIVRDYPDWKPGMVETRRRILAEQLEQYRQAAASAPIPSGRQPGSHVPQDDNIPLPGIEDGPRRTTGRTKPTPPPSDYEPIELPDYDTTDKELYNALARAQEECRRMSAAYKELNARFVETQKKLTSALVDQRLYKEQYDELKKRVEEERKAGNKVVESLTRQLAEMEEKYQASEKARIAAEARVAELEATLEATQEELERVTRERDALRAENQQLRAIVELNSPEKTKALLDQNLTLADQLKQAQEKVAMLERMMAGSTDQNAVYQQQLEAAREEADALREEMSGIYDENRGYRRRISELSQRLTNLEAELEAAANRPVVDPALAEENKLLRDVIAKQRRSLEMQEEGRRLMVESYKQMKNQDASVLLTLQRLDEESSLDLTEAEQRLIGTIRAPEGKPGMEDLAVGADAVRRSLLIESLADSAAKAFSKGRYTAAEQLYRTLYDAQPDHVAGLVNLGTILLYRNKCAEAAEFFERSIRLAPDLAISYYLAGTAYYRMDKMEQAGRMFSRTIELDPANAEAFFFLANIEATTDRVDPALKHFAAAVKLKPTLGDAHYNMARLYAEAQLIPDAARAYDRAVHAGSEPDPEFEAYLRSHPDIAKAPGPDPVETARPEEEADALRAADPEIARLVDEAKQSGLDSNEVDPAATATDSTGAPAATVVMEELPPSTADERDEFLKMKESMAKGNKGASTPSPAGKTHTLAKSRFDERRVAKGPDSNQKVWLRIKKPAPQQLRSRSEATPSAKDKPKGKPSGKSKGKK